MGERDGTFKDEDGARQATDDVALRIKAKRGEGKYREVKFICSRPKSLSDFYLCDEL